jgi:hypothetical protein
VPPEIHLPESILGVHIPLGEEKIMGGVGIDMRYAKLISEYIHIPIQTI